MSYLICSEQWTYSFPVDSPPTPATSFICKQIRHSNIAQVRSSKPSRYSHSRYKIRLLYAWGWIISCSVKSDEERVFSQEQMEGFNACLWGVHWKSTFFSPLSTVGSSLDYIGIYLGTYISFFFSVGGQAEQLDHFKKYPLFSGSSTTNNTSSPAIMRCTMGTYSLRWVSNHHSFDIHRYKYISLECF